MAEKNKGARRRKAFADFKETQYNDSFSISAAQKRKIAASKVFKWAVIIIATAVFIVVGLVFTDALMKISEKKYNDPNTYTPSYVNTTTVSEEETTEQTEEELIINPGE